MLLAEPLEITLLVSRVLRELGVPHLVGGSLASSLHGIPRATQDVDLVADLKPGQVAALVEKLRPDFYVDHDMIIGAIATRGSFNLIHLKTIFKVDVFVLKDGKMAREEMRRRQHVQLSEDPAETLPVATAEDVVLQKLHWYKLGNEISERQWLDVIGVLQIKGAELDRSYLEQTARAMGIEALLSRAIREVDS